MCVKRVKILQCFSKNSARLLHLAPIFSILDIECGLKDSEEPSPEISPTPPSRGRSAQPHAGKTSMSFNKSQSATMDRSGRFSGTNTPLNPRSAPPVPMEKRESLLLARHHCLTSTDAILLNMEKEMTLISRFVTWALLELVERPSMRRSGSPPHRRRLWNLLLRLFYPMGVLRKHRD